MEAGEEVNLAAAVRMCSCADVVAYILERKWALM